MLISLVTGAVALILLRSLSAGLGAIDLTAPAQELLTLGVQSVVLGLGGLLAAWYFLTSICVLAIACARLLGQAPTRLEGAVSRYGAPLLRRAATWTAVSALSFAAPALADPHDLDSASAPVPAVEGTGRNSAFLVDLGWAPAPGPVPESRVDPASTSTAEPQADAVDAVEAPPAADPVETATPATHVVEPGDTLWAVAAQHLHRRSGQVTDADIASHWPAWYATNRATIGPNPDLIRPGMILNAPNLETP